MDIAYEANLVICTCNLHYFARKRSKENSHVVTQEEVVAVHGRRSATDPFHRLIQRTCFELKNIWRMLTGRRTTYSTKTRANEKAKYRQVVRPVPNTGVPQSRSLEAPQLPRH